MLVSAMREADWEIASHGLKWIDYKDTPEPDERADLMRGDPHPHRGHRRAPLGWYIGRTSVNSLKLVLEDGGLLLLFGFLCG